MANVERQVPPEYITDDGFGVSEAGLRYLRPLIQGEDPPPYRDGLPDYVRIEPRTIPRKLAPFPR